MEVDVAEPGSGEELLDGFPWPVMCDHRKELVEHDRLGVSEREAAKES